MLGTREIKQRIRSITSIKQITHAMEMVAASRLKRVESRVIASRTFTGKMHQVLSRLISCSPPENPIRCLQTKSTRRKMSGLF